MKITIHKKEYAYNPFEGDSYPIDLDREFEGYEPGQLD